MGKWIGIGILAPAIVAGLTLTSVTPVFTQNEDTGQKSEITALHQKIEKLEGDLNTLNERIEKLESELAKKPDYKMPYTPNYRMPYTPNYRMPYIPKYRLPAPRPFNKPQDDNHYNDPRPIPLVNHK